MIIDYHTHLARHETLTSSFAEFVEHERPHLAEALANVDDPAGALALLDANGIDYAVVLADQTPNVVGLLSTERVAEFCRYSERLIPFANYNPYLQADMPALLEHAVKHLGCRGLKLTPSYGWWAPNDPMMYPLYAQAQTLGIPITFHTGTSVYPNTRQKYAEPLLLDDLATDFPRLRVVMAHGGRGIWYEQGQFLARLHRNFYLELSGLPPKKLLTYFPELDRIATKVVWGSDWPDAPVSIKQNVQDFCALPISDRAKRLILEENPRGLLGI